MNNDKTNLISFDKECFEYAINFKVAINVA